MRTFTSAALTATVFLFSNLFVSSAYTEEQDASADKPANAATIKDSTNKVLKLTDSGLAPSSLSLEQSGGSVFFLNNSTDSLVSIEVEYGTKPGYCATGKMEMQKNGVLRSREPLAPKTFLTICFPQSGTYPLHVFGLRQFPKGIDGTVTVQ